MKWIKKTIKEAKTIKLIRVPSKWDDMPELHSLLTIQMAEDFGCAETAKKYLVETAIMKATGAQPTTDYTQTDYGFMPVYQIVKAEKKFKNIKNFLGFKK